MTTDRAMILTSRKEAAAKLAKTPGVFVSQHQPKDVQGCFCGECPEGSDPEACLAW